MTEEEYAAETLGRIAAEPAQTLPALGGQIGMAHVEGLISDATALYLTGQVEARMQRQRLMAAESRLATFLPPRSKQVAKPPRALERDEATRKRRREKRRFLAKVAAIPAALICGFTPACQAVLAIIGQVCRKLGACEFPVAWIAKVANCSVRTVQNTLTLAKRRGLITVMYRRRMTSILRVAHQAWLDWWANRPSSSKALDSSSFSSSHSHSLKGANSPPDSTGQGDLFAYETDEEVMARYAAEDEEYERQKLEERIRRNVPPGLGAGRKWADPVRLKDLLHTLFPETEDARARRWDALVERPRTEQQALVWRYMEKK